MTETIDEYFDDIIRNCEQELIKKQLKDYANNRIADCHYAVKLGLFEKRILPSQKVWDNKKTKYNFFYSRVGEKIDLKYVISPHSMVPCYTTNFMDCLELAITSGMTTLAVGKEKELITQILDFIDNNQ